MILKERKLYLLLNQVKPKNKAILKTELKTIQKIRYQDLLDILQKAKNSEGITIYNTPLMNCNSHIPYMKGVYCWGDKIYLNPSKRFNIGSELAHKKVKIFDVIISILKKLQNKNIIYFYDNITIEGNELILRFHIKQISNQDKYYCSYFIKNLEYRFKIVGCYE